MVEGVSQTAKTQDSTPSEAGSVFGNAVGQAKTSNDSNSTSRGLSTEKQLSWSDLQTGAALGGAGNHCLVATPKGACSTAKKPSKSCKKKNPSKLKGKLMAFLKKVTRWNQKRKRSKQDKQQKKRQNQQDKTP